jgi:hypothetical protein
MDVGGYEWQYGCQTHYLADDDSRFVVTWTPGPSIDMPVQPTDHGCDHASHVMKTIQYPDRDAALTLYLQAIVS